MLRLGTLLIVTAALPALCRGAEQDSTLRASGPPRIHFGQVQVIKWRANAEQPTVTLVNQSHRTEIRTRMVSVTRIQVERRLISVMEDGKEVQREIAVQVPVTEEVEQQYEVLVPEVDLKLTNLAATKVKLWNLDGDLIPVASFPELLKKPRHVFVLSKPWKEQPPVDAFYKSVLREDVLFLFINQLQDQAAVEPSR